MCGRFNLHTPVDQLVAMFHLQPMPWIEPRYNIAPMQMILAIRQSEHGREAHLLRWGLVPQWSRDESSAARLINARGETVADKPSFRAAFKRRRCLIPADGFYEWHAEPGRNKQPYHIHQADGQTMTFAGLWEHWQKEDGGLLETCTIITTEANDLLRGIHDRMPVILSQADHGVWLDPEIDDRTALLPLLTPYPADRLQMEPISTLVNNIRHEGPELIKPVREQGSLFD